MTDQWNRGIREEEAKRIKPMNTVVSDKEKDESVAFKGGKEVPQEFKVEVDTRVVVAIFLLACFCETKGFFPTRSQSHWNFCRAYVMRYPSQ